MKKTFLVLLVAIFTLSFVFAQGNEEIISYETLTQEQMVVSNFTPSAESKLVPEIQQVIVEKLPELNIVQYEDFPTEEGYVNTDDFEQVILGDDEPIILVTDDKVIHKGEEAEIIGAVLKKYVEIIPYANRDMLTETEGNDIVVAFEQLADAKEFTEVVEDLDDFLDEEASSDLAATQIFYVRPRADIEEYIDEHDTFNLRITFQLHLRVDQEPPVIIVKIANSNIWYTIDPKSMIRDWLGEGNLTVDLHHFGTVVFLEPRK